MNKSYSVTDIMDWKFEDHQIPDEWRRHLGDIAGRFTMYIDGDGGHGKTEYVLMLAKMLALSVGKTRLNNVEQGKHKQIKESIIRNRFNDLPPGKFQYNSILDVAAYKEKLSRPNSGKNQIIDSISYWPLNVKQVQELIETYTRKSFAFVAYKAHYAQNRPIAHLCDIKVRIEDFVAYPSGRFGGNEPFVIWDRPKVSNTNQLKIGL